LATAHFKRAEDAIVATGKALGLPLLLVDDAALRAVSLRALTRSKPSLAVSGTPSVSETTALAAAGQDAKLLGPRVAVGPVTCAIAIAGALP
jgi:cobalt-precorrin 5A hydrolase